MGGYYEDFEPGHDWKDMESYAKQRVFEATANLEKELFEVKARAEKVEILQSFRESIITSAERFFSVFETGDKEVPEFAEQEWMELGMALRFYLEEGGEIK